MNFCFLLLLAGIPWIAVLLALAGTATDLLKQAAVVQEAPPPAEWARR